MFAGMIFKREPFFQGSDNYDQLVKIAKVLGTEELFGYLDKYQLTLDRVYDDLLPQNPIPRKPWTKFVNSQNSHLVSEDALNLLSMMLRYDHNERVTPKDAMNHQYFQPVREHHAQTAQ